ncbi:GNAT family N-acetyltransferase [Corynebacterium uterequi]|uniref:Putative acetyltransferase n=1 Tax=Corynebacterium uterequi TaxID=1072256 RepID=A0A0G3HER5_9CORY|nr:GNAT family N-acetyltransferase [Corynebacterium uterequi]AKK11799.1 putative acetyltransferase [Corynebacterium uterequi]
MTTAVFHDEPHSRYVIAVDGVEAGFAAYQAVDGIVDFDHTVIAESFRGRGLSTQLIAEALDDVRERGGVIRPSCSAVRRFVEKNSAYDDLVAQR